MSEELVLPSGLALEDQLRAEAREKIDGAHARRLEEERNLKIEQHYEERAERLMRKIWKECGKRTKHYDRVHIDGRMYQCQVCNAPLTKHEDKSKFSIRDSAAREGFKKLGHQLREADRQAGIEWIPV